jgi:hypothetical protein
VDRVYSGRHLNDQSVYHSDDASNYDEPSVENEHEPDAIQEVRNGIVNERDLDLEKADTAEPELEKSRTTKSNRSRHDPKLVGCFMFPNLHSILSGTGKMGRS